MIFADPSVCPDCRSPLGGAVVCRRCGLDLSSRPARELWQTLRRADALLASARAASSRTAPVEPAAPAAPVQQSQPQPTAPAAPEGRPSLAEVAREAAPWPTGPRAPMAPTPTTARPAVSVGSVLLGLGAFMIVVAAIIFVSLAWSVLGVLGRCLVMAVVTALVAALAALLTRRGLRASAEATWVLVLALVSVDWFAAYGLDLAGLGSASAAVVVALWALVLLGLGLLVGRWSRRVTGTALRSPGLTGVGATLVGAPLVAGALVAEHGWWPAWAVPVASLLVVAALAASRATGDESRPVALWGTALALAAVATAAVERLVAHPDEWPSGLPLLLVAVALLGAAAAWRRGRVPLSCAGVLALAVLVLVPLQDADPARTSLVVLALLAVALAAVPATPGEWSRGLRLAAVPLAAVLALALVGWWAELLNAVDSGTTSVFLAEPGTSGLDRVVPAQLSSPWWAVLVAGLALAAVVLLAGRSAELGAARPWTRTAAAVVAALTDGPVLQAAELPLVVVCAATVVALVAAAGSDPARPWPVPVGVLAVAAAAALLVVASGESSFVVWCLLGVAAGVLAYLDDRPEVRAVATGVGVLAVAGAVPLAVSLGADGARPWTLVAAVVAVAVLGGSLLVDGLDRVAVQVAAVPLALAAVSEAPSLGWSALVWCVLGTGLVLVSLRLTPSRWWRWGGAAALGVSWVARLAASDVDVVEAYTAPFALVLLVAGVLAMRRRPELSSEAGLGAGLTLALLPSLPLVLGDPASLRGLLLGLVALALLLGGLRLQWRAPLVGGAVVLALVTVANLGAYVLALPRWLLLALGGALLLGVGIRWEAAVRRGRALVGRLSALR